MSAPAALFAPATFARPVPRIRLLVVRVASRTFVEVSRVDLARLFQPGDVVVVNDAATLPAAVFGVARGAPVELRLLGTPDAAGECDAAILGAGDPRRGGAPTEDWRTPTERRTAPPPLETGDVVSLGAVSASVVSPPRGRRLRLRFGGSRDATVAALYAAGRPVQYAHVPEPLPLWDVQNVYAGEPWAAEMPSAGRILGFSELDALRKRGVVVARLTHGAGLSSVGDASLDAALPWPERYRIPAETADAIARARRVVAVGTSVVRALESSFAAHGAVRAEEAVTDLRIDARHRPGVVSGLLTGMHDRSTSHADLESAFVPRDLLSAASAFAAARGFLGHELGDSCLILPE